VLRLEDRRLPHLTRVSMNLSKLQRPIERRKLWSAWVRTYSRVRLSRQARHQSSASSPPRHRPQSRCSGRRHPRRRRRPRRMPRLIRVSDESDALLGCEHTLDFAFLLERVVGGGRRGGRHGAVCAPSISANGLAWIIRSKSTYCEAGSSRPWRWACFESSCSEVLGEVDGVAKLCGSRGRMSFICMWA